MSGIRWLGTQRVARLGYRPAMPRHLFTEPRPRADELLRRFAASPDPNGIEPLLGRPFDQGQSGSCTAGSTCKAYRASLQRGGAELPWEDFSPHFQYGATHDVERGEMFPLGSTAALPDLEDNGAMPDDCIIASELYGLKGIGPLAEGGRYYDLWTPFDGDSRPANVNDEPDLEDAETAGKHVAAGAYDVDLTASDLDAQLAALPVRGIGSTLALFVDTQNFEGWDPNRGPITKIDLRDPQGGGHQICGPTRTYMSPTYGLIIRFLNSWGPGWGMNGYGEITFAGLRPALDAAIAYDSRWRETRVAT
jgi:hypothetical protein